MDGRAPNASVSYVNEAWEDREVFQSNVSECVAFSTSCYSPVGQADDWMWSPPLTLTAGALLSWLSTGQVHGRYQNAHLALFSRCHIVLELNHDAPA